MFCKNCGKEMKESDAFCPVCGTRNDSNAAQNAGRIDGKAFQSNMANYAAANMAVQKKSQKKPLIIVGIILAAIIAVVILAVVLLGSDISTVKNGCLNYVPTQSLKVQDLSSNVALTIC